MKTEKTTVYQNEHVTIRRETGADHATVEDLVRRAFWNVYRPGCSEHYVLHCLRKAPDFVPELDLVLEVDGRLIGQICFVRAKILADDGRTVPVMTFGPVAILPEHQRQGYGKLLLDAALDRAAELGAGAICMEGDIGFYGRCGFVTAGMRGIDYHGMPRGADAPFFLLRELTPGYLEGVTGVYHTPACYFVEDADVEAFDQAFPPMEKLRLPGQIFG